MAEFDKKGIQLVAHGEGGSSARLAWWNEGPSTPAPGFSIRRGPLPASPSVCYDRPARSPAFVRRLLGTPGQGNTNAKTFLEEAASAHADLLLRAAGDKADPEVVGGPVHAAAGDAGAGKHNGLHEGPVLAAAVGINSRN